MGSFHTDIKFVSPPTRVLHPNSMGTDLTLSGTIAAAAGTVSGNMGVGGTVIAAAGTVSGAFGIAGAATVSGTATLGAGTVTGALGVGGAFSVVGTATLAAGTVSGALGVAGALSTSGTVTAAAGTVSGALGVAGALSTSGTVTAAAGTVSGALGVAGALSTSGTVTASAGTVTNALNVGGTVTAAGISIGPLFSYVRSANVNNVTGNGTVYTCPFDTAIISNANYSGGTFTAPAAGKYLLVTHVSMTAGDSSGTQAVVQIVTTGQSFRVDIDPYTNRNKGSGVTSVAIAVIASLATNDTAKVTLQITGSGSDNGTFNGGSGFSSFAGWRVG